MVYLPLVEPQKDMCIVVHDNEMVQLVHMLAALVVGMQVLAKARMKAEVLDRMVARMKVEVLDMMVEAVYRL